MNNELSTAAGPLVIFVDFNDWDENNYLTVTTKELPEHTRLCVGDRYLGEDADGNRCEVRVERVSYGVVKLGAKWDTWQSAVGN